jgi:hypothetical protein
VAACATDTGMRRSTATAVLLATLLLAFPAISVAQSAGDNQYSDPLQGNGGNSTNGNATSTGGGGGGGSTPSGSSGGGGNAPVAAPNTMAQAPTTETASTAQEGSPTPQGELPRTGFNVILTIELGLAMLLCGVVVQRMVVLRDRREHR